MKKIISSIVLLSIIFAIGIYIIGIYKNEPQISLNFNVSNLTDEEFQYVGTKGLDNPTKNDFKNIAFLLTSLMVKYIIYT